MLKTMKIAGVDGGCLRAGFEKWIDIEQFNSIISGFRNVPGIQSEDRAGKATYMPIAICKKPDCASASLFIKTVLGDSFPTVDFVFSALDANNPKVLAITLIDAKISQREITTMADGSEVEVINFVCVKMKVESFNAQGQAVNAFTYNFATGKKE
jgi:type VI protein secretion system component Hcp